LGSRGNVKTPERKFKRKEVSLIHQSITPSPLRKKNRNDTTVRKLMFASETIDLIQQANAFERTQQEKD
jgi:hypothetical protein